MLILISASTLFFPLEWGDPLGVLVLVLAAVVGRGGLGHDHHGPGPHTRAGQRHRWSAVMLIFGILGGSPSSAWTMLPSLVPTVSKITPNAWGLDGFTTLALGGRLGQILEPVIALIGDGGSAVCPRRDCYKPARITCSA